MNIRQELVTRGCLYVSDTDEPLPYHFVGVSGNHLGGYNNFDPALTDIDFLKELTRQLVAPFVRGDRRIGVVVTAATGSIPIGALSALAIMEAEGRSDVRSVWADKVRELDELTFGFPRTGFPEAIREASARGEDALLVEDMINRQFTIRNLLAATARHGGRVAGVSTVAANRDVNTSALRVERFQRLCEVYYPTWSPAGCAEEGPCSRGVPIVVDEALGHGAEYAERHPDYNGGFIRLLGAAASI